MKTEPINREVLMSIKEALGDKTISQIKVIENNALPDDVMVVSSYIFKNIKDQTQVVNK